MTDPVRLQAFRDVLKLIERLPLERHRAIEGDADPFAHGHRHARRQIHYRVRTMMGQTDKNPLPGDEQEPQMSAWRVYWLSKLTGAMGRGSPYQDRRTAEAWAEYGNLEWPDVEHWVEEVALSELPQKEGTP